MTVGGETKHLTAHACATKRPHLLVCENEDASPLERGVVNDVLQLLSGNSYSSPIS